MSSADVDVPAEPWLANLRRGPIVEALQELTDPARLTAEAAACRRAYADLAAQPVGADSAEAIGVRMARSRQRRYAITIAANPNTPVDVAGTLLVPVLINCAGPRSIRAAALAAATATWPPEVVDAAAALAAADPVACWDTTLDVALAVTGHTAMRAVIGDR